MKKRLLSWLMVLTLCLTLLPTAALAAEDGEDESEQNISVQSSEEHQGHCICGAKHKEIGNHTSEEKPDSFERLWTVSGQLKKGEVGWKSEDIGHTSGYVLKPGNYYLHSDITVDKPIYITGGKVTLCLNGNTIMGPNDDGGDGCVIRVQNGAAVFTLTDCKNNTGKITHAEGAKGSGVDVAVGTFNMYGGSITGNTRSEGLGGVHVGSNSGTAFNLYGGSITCNKAGYGGGVCVEGSGIFRMYGGTIENNTAASESNTVRSEGGGVCIYGSATFEMSGGTIENNSAAEKGGGVYVNSNATFTVSGDAVVTKNWNGSGSTYSQEKANNVYLPEGKTITIGGALGDSASIGVTTKITPEEGSTVTIATGVTTDYSGKFTSDMDGYEVKYDATNQKLVLKAAGTSTPPVEEKHEHYLCGATHESVGNHTETGETSFDKKLWVENGTLKKGSEDWTTSTETSGNVTNTYYSLAAGEYYLDSDLNLSYPIYLTGGTVSLCLNGKSITLTQESNANTYVIAYKDGATLNLTDCKPEGKVGTITHGKSNNKIKYGGGVFMNNSSATFNMYGGKITGNNSYGNNGGGVYVGGTFNMYGGEITDNSSTQNGGGVNVSGTFNMYGGSIIGNTATDNGGGVYVGGTFTVSGAAKITGNKVGEANNNVYLPSGKTITVGDMANGASIGVTTGQEPTADNSVKITDATNDTGLTNIITSDNSKYKTAVSGNTIVLRVKDDTPPPTPSKTDAGVKITSENANEKAPTEVVCGSTFKLGTTLQSTGTAGSSTTGKWTWSSSDSGVLQITEDNGSAATVEALTVGTATITVKYESENAEGTATATITVKPADPAPSTPSSSGGSSYTPTYPVSAPSRTEHGSVSVSPKSAGKGDTVTITVKPDSGYVLETLTVTDKNGNELTLKDKGNGKYTFTMPAGKVEIKAAFAEEAETGPFADVAADDYYYEAVKWAADKGITGGIGNGLFGSDQPCTRAQIVTFLWRAAGSPEPKGDVAGMTDVAGGSYYEKAVAWAVENGVTTGAGDGKFSPDATCTRAQAVTFLARALNAKATNAAEFSDVPTDSYFADAVAWAAANGVTEGVGSGLFGPNNNCTRAQIVTFLWRAYTK